MDVLESFWLRTIFPEDQGFEEGAYRSVVECNAATALWGDFAIQKKSTSRTLWNFWKRIELEIIEKLARLAPFGQSRCRCISRFVASYLLSVLFRIDVPFRKRTGGKKQALYANIRSRKPR